MNIDKVIEQFTYDIEMCKAFPNDANDKTREAMENCINFFNDNRDIIGWFEDYKNNALDKLFYRCKRASIYPNIEVNAKFVALDDLKEIVDGIKNE